ncbi:hypothetical protein HK405_000028 [Cladochytrium tenue]|nr:hypothetical protein HK405_000028 [Cladochytrium tenue]
MVVRCLADRVRPLCDDAVWTSMQEPSQLAAAHARRAGDWTANALSSTIQLAELMPAALRLYYPPRPPTMPTVTADIFDDGDTDADYRAMESALEEKLEAWRAVVPASHMLATEGDADAVAAAVDGAAPGGQAALVNFLLYQSLVGSMLRRRACRHLRGMYGVVQCSWTDTRPLQPVSEAECDDKSHGGGAVADGSGGARGLAELAERLRDSMAFQRSLEVGEAVLRLGGALRQGRARVYALPPFTFFLLLNAAMPLYLSELLRAARRGGEGGSADDNGGSGGHPRRALRRELPPTMQTASALLETAGQFCQPFSVVERALVALLDDVGISRGGSDGGEAEAEGAGRSALTVAGGGDGGGGPGVAAMAKETAATPAARWSPVSAREMAASLRIPRMASLMEFRDILAAVAALNVNGSSGGGSSVGGKAMELGPVVGRHGGDGGLVDSF